MSLLAKLSRVAAVLCLAALPLRGQAPHPIQRVANILSVAVEEYAKGIDTQGRTISVEEYNEAVGFLNDARVAVQRLPG